MALFRTGYKERQQLSHVAVSAPNSLPIWCYLDMVVHEQAQLIGGLALKSRGQANVEPMLVPIVAYSVGRQAFLISRGLL
jgi:hypothetical protein